MNADVAAIISFSLIVFSVCVFVFCVLDTRTNFNNAKPNRVYNFEYIQPVTGERERFLAKVVSNDKWTEHEISRLNHRSDYRWNDKNFKREGNLINCVMPNGEYRRFWSGRVVNCKFIPAGGLMYRFASLI